MNRRRFLRVAAVAGAGSLAGCTSHSLQEAERKPPPFEPISAEEVDLPVPQRLEVAAEEIERAADAEVRGPDELDAYLNERGVRVERLAEAIEDGRPLLELESVLEVTVEEGLMHHLGVAAGGYAALVEATHESERLVVHLLDPGDELFGEYEVRRHWAEKYVAGEYTARKYADEVAVTLEST